MLVNCTMTCESIDIIILLMELLILTFNYRKVHMEFFGRTFCAVMHRM